MAHHPRPPMSLVKSTNLKSVGYDPTERTLDIEFHSGSTYRYFNVPRQVHDSLVAAPSKGTFFESGIRNRFRSLKI